MIKNKLSIGTRLVRKIAATAKLSKTKLQADEGESKLTRLSPKVIQTHCKSDGLSVVMMWPHYGVTGLPRP